MPRNACQRGCQKERGPLARSSHLAGSGSHPWLGGQAPQRPVWRAAAV